MRDNNDLIWIGRAASFAAKLSDMRDGGYCTYVSSRVHSALNKNARHDETGESRWASAQFAFAGKLETVYKSNHWKKP